jgi:hypothetical protein
MVITTAIKKYLALSFMDLFTKYSIITIIKSKVIKIIDKLSKVNLLKLANVNVKENNIKLF